MPARAQADIFVYQPGGTNRRASEGVAIYTDFAVLWADVQASTAIEREILIDDTFTAVPAIPTGSYNLSGIRLRGRQSLRPSQEGFVFLSLPSGTTLQEATYMENFLVNHPAAAGISITYSSGSETNVIYRKCFFYTVASETLISISGGTTVLMNLHERSQLGAGQNVINMTAADTLSLRAFGRSSVADDVVTGPVGATLANISIEAGSYMNQTQSNFSGTGTLEDNSAGLVAYTASVPGDWAVSPPNDVASAIDRIASLVASIHGTI